MSPEVAVGPFRVRDATCEELLGQVVGLLDVARERPVTMFALHVGGLNHRSNPDFVAAMGAADLVYADGGAVVWLARLAGADHVQRAPTTDFGWDVLRVLAERLARPPRVALIGGHDGLARRAGTALERAGSASVVAVEHGYHNDWSAPLERVRAASPDLTLVGLGAPLEMVWTHERRGMLPPGVVLTCGGWFGFLAGDEHRAPGLLRRSGLEWIARVVQSPRRLGPRYAIGLLSTAVMAGKVVGQRVGESRQGVARQPDIDGAD
jgi:N-acetylglucosaminyldiphosphoundecaprenol N-acetyl-beta-D-mannosaminyltransferase